MMEHTAVSGVRMLQCWLLERIVLYDGVHSSVGCSNILVLYIRKILCQVLEHIAVSEVGTLLCHLLEHNKDFSVGAFYNRGTTVQLNSQLYVLNLSSGTIRFV